MPSCIGIRKNVDISLKSNYISFDKVKLKIINNSIGFKSVGHIYLIKDSLISFKFWGPLGFELVKGEYNNNLNFYSYFDKKDYTNFDKKIFSTYHFKINRNSVEYLLLGDKLQFISEINKLNKDNSNIEINQSSNLILIKDTSENTKITIRFQMKYNYPKHIDILLEDNNGKMNIGIEISSINNTKVN